MPIEILMRKTAGQVDRRNLRHHLGVMLRSLGRSQAVVSLLLTDDEEMRQLNATYRNINRVTDVLSFPLSSPDDPFVADCLGDVVIDVPQVLRQAQRHGIAPTEELLTVARHGVWHLLGYDHHREGLRRWLERDRLLLAQIETQIHQKRS